MAAEKKDDVFADGVGEITLVGGMVRMDLVSLSATEKDSNGNPSLEFRQRVVMPPDGFLRSFSAMENLVKQLMEAGVVQKNQDNEEGGGSAPVGRAQDPPPKSPNF